MYKKRWFFLSCSILFAYSCTNEINLQELAKPQPEYSFFTAGHAYGEPGVDNIGLHPAMSEVFPFLNERVDIELGVFTGDVVLHSTKENWEELAADLEMLNVETYIAPGNHDLDNIDLYEIYNGETEFSFTSNGDLFVILETTTTNWNITTQKIQKLKWDIDCKLNSSDRIFIFCHQLIWYEEGTKYDNCLPNSQEGKDGITDFFSEFLPMLQSLEQEVVVYAGDIGAFPNGCSIMYEELGNVSLIASGMGGGISDNIVITNVYDTGEIDFEIIALNGDDRSKLGEIEDYRI